MDVVKNIFKIRREKALKMIFGDNNLEFLDE